MPSNQYSFLSKPDNRRIAYHHTPGNHPGVIFLGGFMSDMTGTKAIALESWCLQHGISFTRFDYSGHGSSSGSFQEGTIGTWLEDAIDVLDKVTHGPQIIVGSSMGGWLALLLTLRRPQRVAGLLTIACATDFTERLLRPALSAQQLEELEHAGFTELPTAYRETSFRIGRILLDEGNNHLLLHAPINIDCPIIMLHGTADTDVPVAFSHMTLERITSRYSARLILIEGGDHRLSCPEHLETITNELSRLRSEVA